MNPNVIHVHSMVDGKWPKSLIDHCWPMCISIYEDGVGCLFKVKSVLFGLLTLLMGQGML
jgi:hypothetical protein